VLAYFHGGSFCIGSGRWPNFHAWCLRLADGARAMSWLHSAAAADPWLADVADFARIIVATRRAATSHTTIAAGLVKAGLGPAVCIRGALLLASTMANDFCFLFGRK
jgi:hypothetical protein